MDVDPINRRKDMTDTMTEDMFFIHCEKIVNETWSKTAIHYDDIKAIVEKGGPENEYEQSIVMIAANATLQKLTFDKAADQRYFDLSAEKSPCARWRRQCVLPQRRPQSRRSCHR